PPERVSYFSFDDPEVFASEEAQRVVFDLLIELMRPLEGTAYLFLDEVQRLPRWELYLKKYYDLKYPFRFVVSGPASSPIIRSSKERLWGRVKDRHLLPFSLREYCLYELRNRPDFQAALADHCRLRPALLNRDGPAAAECVRQAMEALGSFQTVLNKAVT